MKIFFNLVQVLVIVFAMPSAGLSQMKSYTDENGNKHYISNNNNYYLDNPVSPRKSRFDVDDENMINVSEDKIKEKKEAIIIATNDLKSNNKDWVIVDGFRDIKFGMSFVDFQKLEYQLKKINLKQDGGEEISFILAAGDTTDPNEMMNNLLTLGNKNKINFYWNLLNFTSCYNVEELNSEPSVTIVFDDSKLVESIILEFNFIGSNLAKALEIFNGLYAKYKVDVKHNINDGFENRKLTKSISNVYETTIFNSGTVAYDAYSLNDPTSGLEMINLRLYYISPVISSQNLNKFSETIREIIEKHEATNSHKDVLGDL